jgi:hypothetical protein
VERDLLRIDEPVQGPAGHAGLPREFRHSDHRLTFHKSILPHCSTGAPLHHIGEPATMRCSDVVQ